LLRSLDPAELGPLLRKPGCSIVNLQYGLQNVELHRVVEQIGDPLPDLAKAVGDNIDELAAGIAGLDLVITVDNTIAHLSAALGIPTWVLVPYSPEWRYGLGAETVVWYPTMRLFRQSLPRQWSPVIERVSACL
jgi:ADP-heptose:LPS heptosyltransferase